MAEVLGFSAALRLYGVALRRSVLDPSVTHRESLSVPGG